MLYGVSAAATTTTITTSTVAAAAFLVLLVRFCHAIVTLYVCHPIQNAVATVSCQSVAHIASRVRQTDDPGMADRVCFIVPTV